MPRSGGVYSLPAGSLVVNGITGDASQHNTPLVDIAADLNAARPISSGGTGATTAADARTSLGLGTAAVQSDDRYAHRANNLSDLASASTALINLGVNVTAAQINEGLAPPGSVIFHAANTAPTGYLKANGALVSRSTYAALFSAIGTTFGAGDGSTTFALPDLRGEFTRGWDDGRGIDSGRAFGSAQSGMVGNHTHGLPTDLTRGQTVGSAWTYEAGVNNRAFAPGETQGVVGTATETRPRNIALLACIKF